MYFLKEMQIKSNFSPEYNYVRGFQTNGNSWKLFEVHDNMVKKTKFFNSNSKIFFKEKH